MIKIKKYESTNQQLWDSFIDNSKNATFLFKRGFMEYHQDRFQDYSLLCYKADKLIAVLPANRVQDVLYSHQGLTYGGLIVQSSLRFEDYLNVFERLLQFLNEDEIKILRLKQLPSIYTSCPSEEFDYIKFLLKAKLIRSDISSTVKINHKKKFSNSRIEGGKRAEKYGLIVREENDLTSFWKEILIPNLLEKHNVAPVHSLKEISLLKEQFPKNIRQFNVYHKEKIVAGTTIFESAQVAHSQYISANEDKNKLGSLDILHFKLINDVYKDKAYFDFGISNEDQGKKINYGLLFWKEGFGARAIVYEQYEIVTENYKNLSNVFI